MRIAGCLIAFLVFMSVDASGFRLNRELDASWEQFKTTYRKEYATTTHELMRRIIWEYNLHYIQKHNLEADLNMHSYRLGINEFGDLTNFEYQSFLLSKRPTNLSSSEASTFLEPSNIRLPKTVDWRTKGYVTPVKNQKQCGSCWAFSATGSLEGQHFKKTGKLVSLSEQNLVDCSRPQGNLGCDGGLQDYAFKYIQKNGGIDTEASYPYKARNGRCHYNPANKGATVRGYVDVKRGSESALLKATATVGPISVGIDASHMSFQFYKSGVYNERRCSTTQLDHGVLVVGYGTERGRPYWLVKNSWGATWGLSGYIKMSRNKHNQCGIATSASYPLV